MFVEYLWEDPVFYLTWVLLIMFSICFHEMSHAWVAVHQGDTTAADQGYLTLNPLKVMGLTSMVLLALFGIAFGAVPVRQSRMRQPLGPAITALAGPGSNAILMLIFTLLARLAGEAAGGQLRSFLAIGVIVNAFLFLFNMLPIPILDGWEVYRAVIPALRRVPTAKARQFGMLALLVILFAGLHNHIARAAAKIAGFLLGS